MRHFTISTDIAAPANRVWDVMSDVERWHEWTASITRVRRLTDGPVAVGTRVVIHQPKFPPAKWTVTAIQPGRSFTWESVAPGLRVTGHHAVDPSPTGSRATLTLDFHGILGGFWGMLTGRITKRYIGYEAAGLKARSERPDYHRAPSKR